jgi:copper homeostasis protein (lipoprotein)
MGKKEIVFICILTGIIFSVALLDWYKIHRTKPQVSTSVTSHKPTQHFLLFAGKLPCADCEGIQTDITFLYDQNSTPKNYIMRQIYLGRSDTPFVTSGAWSVSKGTSFDANALVYALQEANSLDITYYLKLPHAVQLLDAHKEKITSSFDMTLQEKKE